MPLAKFMGLKVGVGGVGEKCGAGSAGDREKPQGPRAGSQGSHRVLRTVCAVRDGQIG